MADPFLGIVTDHLDWHLRHAVWAETREHSGLDGLWWSMLDLKTGLPPREDRPAGVPKRCYRWIESPRGSNLYWDGPLVAACQAMSARTGKSAYADGAARYIRQYFKAGASPGGLLWWGNHYYISYDAGGAVSFGGNEPPVPVDASHSKAKWHETRPLPVPWELYWRLEPDRVMRMLEGHVGHLVEGGPAGCYNRHADGKDGLPFIESGGMLALSQAYLARFTGDGSARMRCREIVEFVWSGRDGRTGLVPVSPGAARWDGLVATSEVGLWAGAVLACARVLEEASLAEVACEALRAWVERAWSPSPGQFQGRTRLSDGVHDRAAQSTIYQPGMWSDPWEPLFPGHDYPMQAAEACVEAWRITGEAVFATACRRWAEVLGRQTPAGNGKGGYAEAYGRAIHFLWHAGKMLGERAWVEQARAMAEEAVSVLGKEGRLAGHPWEARVDSVDGVGWLILALLALEGDVEPDIAGMFW